MLLPAFTGQFKRDRKRLKKRGWDIDHLNRVVARLVNEEALAVRYKVHPLQGEYAKHMECHIVPDFLLIWLVTGEEIRFVRTGSHADLFE